MAFVTLRGDDGDFDVNTDHIIAVTPDKTVIGRSVLMVATGAFISLPGGYQEISRKIKMAAAPIGTVMQ